jgi:hypothetical protein
VTIARSKIIGVVAAIALVALAAVGLRLSEPSDNFQVITGGPGVPVKINNGELTVTQVKVGSFLQENDQVTDRSAGMFVAVTVTAAATGPDQLKLGSARLLSKQVHYDSYKIAAGINASPGFQVSADTLFEVDPAQIDDLTLEMWPNEVISGYQQRVQIKLGITGSTAEQWRGAARNQGIEISPGTTRAIP